MGPSSREVVVLIPARGGSKSIPLKNIAPIAGRPLLFWVASACARSPAVKEVVVATDSPAIRRCVEALGLPKVRCVGRGRKTATDTASTESVLLEFAGQCSAPHIALVQATSPLLISRDVTAALKKYFSSGADSLLTVVREKRFLWVEEGKFARPLNYDPSRRPRRQEWAGHLIENGALYVTSRQRLLASACRISGRIAVHEMPLETAVEIDEPADWAHVEHLLQRREGIVSKSLDLRRLRVLAADVDGTLTDGGMYYGEAGEVMKRFDTRDALGMSLLRKQGLVLVLLTGEDSPIVRARARKLKIGNVFLGVQDKVACLDRFLKKQGLTWDQLAYVGDDLNDLEVVKRAGFAACPADAAPEVAATADYVGRRPGGHGAVREACDTIRRGRGTRARSAAAAR